MTEHIDKQRNTRQRTNPPSPSRAQQAPIQFAQTVHALARHGDPAVSNVTFVLGAGFSHAWDNRYPTGTDLFDFTGDDWASESPFLEDFLRMMHIDRTVGLGRSAFLDIVYQVGMLKKYPLIRNRYVDEFYLELVERELRYAVLRKFHQHVKPPTLVGDTLSFGQPLSDAQTAISSLFAALQEHASATSAGERPAPRIGVNFLTTNYDFVIEAMVDTALRRARSRELYRGFTPFAWCGETHGRAVAVPFASGYLLKLNGGFEIYRREGHFEVDYRRRDTQVLRSNPPDIMLPSRAQDYDQPYFQALFPKAVRLLRESRVVVLVGYSFPDEDALVRLLLRQFAEAPADGRQRVLYYIDLADVQTQFAHARSAFPHASAHGGLAVLPWRGSFSEWCSIAVRSL
ncbi:SIR2 family protein [Mycetohabitans sp. B8]|uniref:SIR2 family protein n=1 Tax=Mycetohabitans sp. B8 TaxID=2841845 RepID=UPI001F1FD6E4|nr:SIR2 family protein [Mycetohabitans sp. B8]MCG1042583.1 SIR2 family protein [Mycetohabitans sp. B8]